MPPLQLVITECGPKDPAHPITYHNININNTKFDIYVVSIIILVKAALIIVITLRWYQHKRGKTGKKEEKEGETERVAMRPLNQTIRYNFLPSPHIYATPRVSPPEIEREKTGKEEK